MPIRFRSLLLLALLSFQACAEELKVPTLDFAEGKAAIQRFLSDYDAFAKDASFFDQPRTAAEWGCPVAQDQLYMAAGLFGALPDKAAATAKMTRKRFRELGMDPDAVSGALPKYEDVSMTPLKSACVAGKLDGEIEMLVSYVSRSEFSNPVTYKERQINVHTVNTNRNTSRVSANFKAGEFRGLNRTISRMFNSSESDYSDPEYAELLKSTMATSNKIVAEQQKHPMLMFMYPDPKNFSTFSLSREAKVSAGLFGVNADYPVKVRSNFKVVESEGREIYYSYENEVISQKMPMRNGKPHGDQTIWMANYLKASNLRLDQMPGMERARIVIVNGVELIEKRQCYIDGVMTQAVDCPSN